MYYYYAFACPVMDITRDLFTEQECLRWSKRKAVTIP